MRVLKKGVFLLAGAILISSLTACSPKQPGGDPQGGGTAEETREDPYEATVMYYVGNDAAPGLAAVEERFNELTMEALNIKVKLLPVTFGTYREQIQLMLSSGEPLDIFPMGPENAGSFIDAQYIVDLTEYLKDSPEIISIVGEEDIACCSVGDFIWGIPTMMERTHPNAFIMRNDILQEIGVQVTDIKNLDDLTNVFAKVHELYPDMIIYGGQYNMSMPFASMHIDKLDNMFGVLDNYGEQPKVVNYYETDTFRKLTNYMRDWYLKGYVSKDLSTCQDRGEKLMKAGNLFSYTTNVKPDSKQEKDTMTGYDTAVYEYNDSLLTTWGTSTVAYAIANNSEDPAKAMELYNWIISTEEANDLLNWGVEGGDWVEAEDGTATFPEGVDIYNVSYHQDYGWGHPNQQNAHLWTGNDPTIFEKYKEEKERAKVSVAYGFSFDARPVVNEIVALSSVRDQYVYTISSGSVDPEEGIREFNEALYNAGLQKVMDEKQTQLDAWLAARNE